MLERAGEPDRCETLLTARREELGTTEGARILGQIFARRGEHDEAITLLTPYLNEHLEALRVANERLAAQFKMAHQEALNEINRRQASAQFYAKYMQADRANDPARKNDLVQEYIGQRMRENEEITRLQAKVASLRAVVPATMDLGIVQLRRAQELSGEARAQELKNAETSFLAVRGQAGDSPLFKLFLGQVYYWMGRDEDGQKLFDELLGPERKPQTLLQVASVMRDLGRDEPARALSEEAFRTATDPEVKHGAAMTRALLRFDAEDEINWLEKADSGYPQVKISLNWARGNQALQQGRRNEAVRFIRASLDGYNGMAESPAMLNNSAMACFTLANITGDLAEFDRGIARLEKAISLNANDATLQKNAARYLLEKAARELIGRTADLSQLQLNINLSTLECFYNDEAGFQAIVAEHGEQAATARAIVFLKKLTVISPKRPDSWKQLAALYLNHRDAPAMKSLLERLQQNNVEVATPLKKWRDYRSGREDTRIRKMAGQSLERNGLARTKHAEARNDTWMLASCSIVASRLSLFTIGDPIDIDGTIAMAEDVLRTNPNNMLRKSHFSLVLHRALRDLARSVPEIEDLHRRFQRDIPPLQLLVIALRRADGHRETIRTHPDVQRAIESIQGDLKLFPKAARAGIVMLFRQLGDDEQADERLQCLKQREDVRLWQRVNAELHPYLPVAVIDAAWHHQLLGEDDQARALLERCSSFGVELPPLE